MRKHDTAQPRLILSSLKGDNWAALYPKVSPKTSQPRETRQGARLHLGIFPDLPRPVRQAYHDGRLDEFLRCLMSAVERLDERQSAAPLAQEAVEDAVAAVEALTEPAVPVRRSKLRPLLALAPYIARYRGRAFLALISLTVAALTTLLVPIAVRRMIDFGFTPKGIELINSYFSVMIAVVAVLAVASAARYYLVMTIGERIVADLRSDVFAHLMSLSPSFFDSARSGELVSRLTADTTQIKAAAGASVSIALRNLLLFVGATAMMVITSPKLSGFVLLAIPLIVLPLVAFGRWVRRLSRNAQDTLAEASA